MCNSRKWIKWFSVYMYVCGCIYMCVYMYINQWSIMLLWNISIITVARFAKRTFKKRYKLVYAEGCQLQNVIEKTCGRDSQNVKSYSLMAESPFAYNLRCGGEYGLNFLEWICITIGGKPLLLYIWYIWLCIGLTQHMKWISVWNTVKYHRKLVEHPCLEFENHSLRNTKDLPRPHQDLVFQFYVLVHYQRHSQEPTS